MYKNPKQWIKLDVDKLACDIGHQVENIVLNANQCDDGVYKYFVRYYSGHGRPTNFTFVTNEFDKKSFEGTGVSIQNPCDVPVVDITMKNGKVVDRKFHLNAKQVFIN